MQIKAKNVWPRPRSISYEDSPQCEANRGGNYQDEQSKAIHKEADFVQFPDAATTTAIRDHAALDI